MRAMLSKLCDLCASSCGLGPGIIVGIMTSILTRQKDRPWPPPSEALEGACQTITLEILRENFSERPSLRDERVDREQLILAVIKACEPVTVHLLLDLLAEADDGTLTRVSDEALEARQSEAATFIKDEIVRQIDQEKYYRQISYKTNDVWDVYSQTVSAMLLFLCRYARDLSLIHI